MKKSILPILAFALVLTACNSNLTSSSSSASSTPVSTASSTSSSSTTSGSSSSSSSSSTTPIPVTESALDLFKTAAEVKNYTFNVVDYGGNSQQFFLEDAFYYQFIGDLKINGFIKDDYGVYAVTVSSTGNVSGGYYYIDDETDEPLQDIYPSLTSLASVSFDEDLYTENNGIYILKDLVGYEARKIFEVIGYDPDSTYSGMNLTDVDEINLQVNENGRPEIHIVFNEKTSGRGTTIAELFDVGTTKLALEIQQALDDGTLYGKHRIDANDVFYDYLGEIKRAKNYTLHVRSEYTKDSWSNYTTDSYFTNNAFYSTSSRDESDLGFVNQSDGVHTLAYDELREEYLVGDKYTYQSETYKDIYEIVSSFSDTSWDPYTFEVRKDGDKYIIDDTEFMYTVFNMLNETMLRFMHLNIEFYKEGDEYNFTLNLREDQKIHLVVTDVGTTTIGNF